MPCEQQECTFFWWRLLVSFSSSSAAAARVGTAVEPGIRTAPQGRENFLVILHVLILRQHPFHLCIDVVAPAIVVIVYIVVVAIVAHTSPP